MIELPDDELDKLFRKSSEELDPQFDPEDWNSLKKRLDQQDGRTAGLWFKKWWPLGLLLLLIPGGIASYFWLSNSEGNKYQNAKPSIEVAVSKPGFNETAVSSEEDKGRQNAVSATPEVSAESNEAVTESEKVSLEKNRKAEKTEIAADNKTAISAKKRTELAATPKIGEAGTVDVQNEVAKGEKLKYRKSSISKSLPRSQSKAGGVYLEPNRSKTGGGDGALILSNKNKELISDSKGTSASELGARQAIGPNGVEEENQELGGVNENKDQKLFIAATMLAGQPVSWKNGVAYPGINPASAQQSEQPVAEKTDESEVEKSAIVESPKWAVRLGYSPDLTSVGFKNLTKPKSAYSLLVEYGVSKKLYLQAGIVRSVKDYNAAASEYEVPKYVSSINAPYSVDGMCTMFEVPIGIRYDIAQMPHSRWFAGTGFSSYYAQKEKYVYHYESYVHGQKPDWNGKTGWYFLSHLNASVGYERTITRKLSILAEPYLRIPLKGVGYGKVNLLTTGMWLSLRYTPVFR